MSNSKIKSDVQFCCSAQRRKAFLGVGSTKITEVWSYKIRELNSSAPIFSDQLWGHRNFMKILFRSKISTNVFHNFTWHLEDSC
jgi:hypothetical protein